MIKRLFFDIEVSPNIGFFWRAGWKISVSPESILEERAIICIAWKWEGKDEVHSVQWDKGDDKKLLKKFVEVANSADQLVAHNGARFDVKWLRGRCLFHEIKVFPSYQVFDTLTKSRSAFNLNSHKQDYLDKYTGGEGKSHTTYDMWTYLTSYAFLGRGNLKEYKKILAEMVQYCKDDIAGLERYFIKIQPYVTPQLHAGTLNRQHKWTCPYCGSDPLKSNKKRSTAAGYIKMQMVCRGCDRYYTVAESTYNNWVDERKARKRRAKENPK